MSTDPNKAKAFQDGSLHESRLDQIKRHFKEIPGWKKGAILGAVIIGGTIIVVVTKGAVLPAIPLTLAALGYTMGTMVVLGGVGQLCIEVGKNSPLEKIIQETHTKNELTLRLFIEAI